MSEFTKEDLIEIQADHCQPLYYQLLAAFAARQMERAEKAEALNDKFGKSLSAAMEALGDKHAQLTNVEAERDRLANLLRNIDGLDEKADAVSWSEQADMYADTAWRLLQERDRLKGELEEASGAIIWLAAVKMFNAVPPDQVSAAITRARERSKR